MSEVIEITAQCAPRAGEAGLREQWAAWSPGERQQFVEGLVALGWVPERQPDIESPVYPRFVALPGNPCYLGMTGTPGNGSPGDPMGQQWALSRYPSGLLQWLRDLWARLSDALRRALAAFTGPWLAILAALLVGGGILLASRDRQARA
jgi:hypothetical protein